MTTPYESNGQANDGGRQAGIDGDRKQQAKQQASEMADQAKSAGREQLDRHRGTAAEEIEKLAQGARAAADELDQQHREGIAHYLGDMASAMSTFADDLRHKNADELIRDCTSMARRNPGLFLAGSVAIGFGLSRFARASNRRGELDSGISRGSRSATGQDWDSARDWDSVHEPNTDTTLDLEPASAHGRPEPLGAFYGSAAQAQTRTTAERSSATRDDTGQNRTGGPLS